MGVGLFVCVVSLEGDSVLDSTAPPAPFLCALRLSEVLRVSLREELAGVLGENRLSDFVSSGESDAPVRDGDAVGKLGDAFDDGESLEDIVGLVDLELDRRCSDPDGVSDTSNVADATMEALRDVVKVSESLRDGCSLDADDDCEPVGESDRVQRLILAESDSDIESEGVSDGADVGVVTVASTVARCKSQSSTITHKTNTAVALDVVTCRLISLSFLRARPFLMTLHTRWCVNDVWWMLWQLGDQPHT